MTSPFVVLQHGEGQCREMIKVSFPRTWLWCRTHNLAYEGCTRNLVGEKTPLFWNKIAALLMILKDVDDGVEGVFLDADCHVCNVDADPRGVLPAHLDIGMRWSDVDYKGTRCQFWQGGVIFFRNTVVFRDILEAAWALRFDERGHHGGMPPTYDEWALNEVVGDRCAKIPNEWNAYREHEVPIIRAYHGWSHDRVLEKLADDKMAMSRRAKWSE